jgi:hypothetical protein
MGAITGRRLRVALIDHGTSAYRTAASITTTRATPLWSVASGDISDLLISKAENRLVINNFCFII